MALINHSCAPNSAAMVLQSTVLGGGAAARLLPARLLELGKSRTPRDGATEALLAAAAAAATGASADSAASSPSSELVMLIRAATELEAGQEVTIAYTGSFTTSPLSKRRQLLQSSYGFACSCARCTAESQLVGTSAFGDLEGAYKEIDEELKPLVLAAAEEGDMAQLQLLQEDLLSLSRR